MGLDIYVARGDAWPAYERMSAHYDRLWQKWERRGHDYRPFEVFSDAMARFQRSMSSTALRNGVRAPVALFLGTTGTDPAISPVAA